VNSLEVVLTVVVMLAAGFASQFAADFLRLPRMLVLLGAGALLGPSVSGLIDVPLGSLGADLLLTVGVSLILFHGGLQLSVRVLNPVALGLFLLVIPGVIVTAIVVGVVASAAFAVSTSMGLLIGAALAPTDPAILIPLFERLKIRPKISQSVIAESALNDATGAVFALAVAGVVLGGHLSFTNALQDFVVTLALSVLIGVAFGVALAFAEHPAEAGIAKSAEKVGLARVLAVVAGLGVVAGAYYSIDHFGASGYMGAFIAGLVASNVWRLPRHRGFDDEHELRDAVEMGADVMVMFVFITVGSNLPWSEIAANFWPALAVVGALLLLARPIAVAVCLLPDRRGQWSSRELVFMCWSRETGVMPAALAGIIVGMGVPNGNLVVTCVAIAIVATLSIQSTTKPWLAGRLRLLESDETGPDLPAPSPRPDLRSCRSAG
jgi:cell volume regulation protein A